MGFVDSLRDVMRTFSGEDDYDDAPVSGARTDIYATASTASTAPDYSSYYHAPAQPQEPVQRPTVVPDAAVSTIAMLRATKLESVRAAADHLLENHAVIISVKDMDTALARRWLDYLGGTAYTLDGKINRIAPYTYLLTTKGVQLVSGFESEQ